VGYYHSSTPKFYEVYISKVKKAFANRWFFQMLEWWLFKDLHGNFLISTLDK
jgi:hypothetical protein